MGSVISLLGWRNRTCEYMLYIFILQLHYYPTKIPFSDWFYLMIHSCLRDPTLLSEITPLFYYIRVNVLARYTFPPPLVSAGFWGYDAVMQKCSFLHQSWRNQSSFKALSCHFPWSIPDLALSALAGLWGLFSSFTLWLSQLCDCTPWNASNSHQIICWLCVLLVASMLLCPANPLSLQHPTSHDLLCFVFLTLFLVFMVNLKLPSPCLLKLDILGSNFVFMAFPRI